MADTRADALRRGIGKLDEVSAELRNVPPEDSGMQECISRLHTSLVAIQQFEGADLVVGALLCSYANRQFRERGDLWRLDDTGNIAKNYIGANDGRNAIADLAGL